MKFFDHRVRKNLARYPFHFGLRLVLRDAAIEGDFEILSLAYILQTLVADLFQSAVDGLALGVQHAFFQ